MSKRKNKKEERFVGANYSGGYKSKDSGAVSKFFSSYSQTPSVNSDNALRIMAVNSCVRLIAGGVADLSLYLFNKEGKRINSSSALYVLENAPNNYLTPYEFKELIMTHLLLRGNFFAQIIKNRLGEVVELIPLYPDRVSMKFKETDAGLIITYIVQSDNGVVELPKSEVLHIKNISHDGLWGLNNIELAKSSLEISASAQQYAKRYFDTDGSPVVILKHPSHLGEEALKSLKNSWSANYMGANKRTGIAVLEEGMEFERVTISNSDAQFLESREFQDKEIAKLFGVPYSLLDDTTSNKSISELSQHFVKFTLRPWLSRIEKALTSSLLPKTQSFKFNIDGLLRGDMEARYNSYNVAMQRFMTINEIRRLEGLEPVDNGDGLLQPLNMAPLGMDINEITQTVAEDQVKGAQGNQNVSIKDNQDQPNMRSQILDKLFTIQQKKENVAIANILSKAQDQEDLNKRMQIFEQGINRQIENTLEVLKDINPEAIELSKRFMSGILQACKTENDFDAIKIKHYFENDRKNLILTKLEGNIEK